VNELNCNELVELVTAYLDGALGADDRERVDQHLTLCEGCSGYVEQVKATIAGLGQLTPEPLDEATRARLLEAFRADPA
jgi:anti-sigma factor RsiW